MEYDVRHKRFKTVQGQKRPAIKLVRCFDGISVQTNRNFRTSIFFHFDILEYQAETRKSLEFDYMTGSGLSAISNSGIRAQNGTKKNKNMITKWRNARKKTKKKVFFVHIHRLKCVCIYSPREKSHIKCGAKKKALNLFPAKHTKQNNNSTIIIMIRFGFFFSSIPMCDNIRRIEGVFHSMPLLREISSFGPFYGWHVFHIRTLSQHKHAQNPTSSSIKELWMYVLMVSSICTARFSCYYYHTQILLDGQYHAWKTDFHLCSFFTRKIQPVPQYCHVILI